MSCIALDISFIFWLLVPTALPVSLESPEACWDISAVSLIFTEISFMVALSSSMEEACSVAPCDRDWAEPLTCIAEEFTI